MLVKTVRLRDELEADIHYYKKSRRVSIELGADRTNIVYFVMARPATEVVRLLRGLADIIEAHDKGVTNGTHPERQYEP